MRKERKDDEGKRRFIHRLLGRGEFIHNIQRGRPMAVSFFQLEMDTEAWTYQYQPSLRFMVLDYDIKLSDVPADRLDEIREKICTALEYLDDRMLSFGLHPGITHSGSKGFHHWIFLSEEIDAGYLIGFFREIMIGCPWFEDNGSLWVLRGDDGKTVWAEIDSLIGSGDGKIIKSPFSQHQAREGYWELPIRIEDIRTYQPVENPTDNDFQDAVNVFLEDWRIIPADYVTTIFESYDQFNRRGRPKSRTWRPPGDLHAPQTREGYEKEMDEVEAWLDPRNRRFLPCFYQAVEDSKPPKRSRFNLRTVVARLISSRLKDELKIKHERSKEVAALFIKIYINDADDNAHPERMQYQVNYWCDNHEGIVAKCANLANDTAPFFCCSGPCGRFTPLDMAPGGGDRAILGIPELSKKSLPVILDDARDRSVNLQIYKTTRAGGTSRIVANALEHNERITVVVPNTKIAETIEESLRLASNGDVMIGALFPGNTVACLKLAEKVAEQKDQYPELKPSLEILQQTFKYNCRECIYQGFTLPMEGGTVLKESDISARECLYTTIIHRLEDINVLVLTHKKLYALRMAGITAAANPHLEDIVTDAQRLVGWIEESDVILLDEISMMVDQPDMDLPLMVVPVDPSVSGKKLDIIQLVEDELRQLEQLRGRDDTVEAIYEVMEQVIDEFRIVTNDLDQVKIYRRPMNTTEQTLIAQWLKRIQTFAIKSNIALVHLFGALVASAETDWVVVQVPDSDMEENIRLYTMPKIEKGVSEVLTGSEARVIAMDATHPIANIDSIIGIPFEKVNIGDPQKSAELQRIIPWPTIITSPQLVDRMLAKVRGTDLTWVQDQLRRVLLLMERCFGIEKFLVVVPSKRAYAMLKRIIRREPTLKDLDIIWHRGSESIGVKNDKRIMLGITAPYAPRDSNNWVKEVLYPELLADVPHEFMWRYDRSKTDFQTFSRVKAPRFEEDDQDRSVHIAFGQPIHEVEAMREVVVCPPKAIPIAGVGRLIGDSWAVPILTSWFWIKHGEELSLGDQFAVFHIWNGTEDDRLIQKKVQPHPVTLDRVAWLRTTLENAQI